jgi:hypothetical protein
MAKTVADVMSMVKENEVKFVDFRFTDTRGKQQHTTVPISHFDEEKFTSGHAFDGSSIAGWKGIEASDMQLMPDPNTAVIDPFFEESTLVMTCDVIEPGDGKAYDRDPRSIAKRAEVLVTLHILGLSQSSLFLMVSAGVMSLVKLVMRLRSMRHHGILEQSLKAVIADIGQRSKEGIFPFLQSTVLMICELRCRLFWSR